MKTKGLLFFLLVVICACSGTNEYEEFKTFKNQNWPLDSLAVFDFAVENINDSYRIDGYIRNTLDYPYYNIYMQYELLDEEGLILRSSLKESDLMDAKTGKPLGSGSGSVFDVTFPLIESYKFDKEGNYQLKLRQYMRLDTLFGIQAVGFKLAKVQK